MAEYIEREAMKENLEKINPVDFGGWMDWEMHKGAEEALRFVGYAVDEVPAADVAPVRHGRWCDPESDDGGYEWHCSCCGFPARVLLGPPGYQYCPGCGAMMDGESEK